jgi:tripartite-type tricarboxylate transporter receptor subunit TctC
MYRTGLLISIGILGCASALAQTYPTKPVRVIIPISAGSGLDIIGRWVCQKLSATWGQPVVVDNRSGAGGVVGTATVAKSAADGYTLLVSGSAHAINSAIYAKLPYDTLNDFVEIAPLAALYQVLVLPPTAGIKSVSELVAAAKAKPGRITFASPGTGSGVHFTGERFRVATNIDVVHVPYKGGPEAMNDVMMGRVTYWIPSIGTALPFIKGGRLLALGVTSRERSAALPDTPTLAEAGVAGFENSLWFGLWAPARTPAAIVDKLAADTARAVGAPDVREQFRTLVAEPMSMKSAEFARFVRTETETAVRLAKLAGIKPQ